MTNSWDRDAKMRPRFLEIMTRLEAMSNESSSTGSFATHPSTSSHGSHSSYGSDTSTGSGREGIAAITAVGGVKPPSGEMAIVFTDIVRSLALWEFNAEVCFPLSFVRCCKKKTEKKRKLNMYHLAGNERCHSDAQQVSSQEFGPV